MIRYISTVIFCSIFVFIQISFAQKSKKEINNMYVHSPIQTNGELSDWNSVTPHINDVKTTLSCMVGNDTSNLYIAVSTTDSLSIRKILTYGLSFTVNTQAKKKPGSGIIFPIIDRKSAVRMNKGNINFNDLNRILIDYTRSIYVMDLTGIINSEVALNNEYGLQAGILLDTENKLIIELSVPLYLLGIDLVTMEWVIYNFKINGAQELNMAKRPPPSSPNNRNFNGPMNGRPQQKPKDKDMLPIDFWVKAKLAKQP